MVSKEFSGLSRDVLFVRDFDKKKPEHKKENWLMGVFAQLDKYNVEKASIFADTSMHIKDKNLLSTLQNMQKNLLIDIQTQTQIQKRMPN